MAASAGLISALEAAVAQDLGKRGVEHLLKPGSLKQAAQFFLDSPSVLIVTGFPCVQSTPPTENDGISGSLALARAALLLKKKVAIITDECNGGVIEGCLSCEEYWGEFATDGGHGTAVVPVHTFPPKTQWNTDEEAKLKAFCAEFDHFVSVERAGAAADGSYYTMRARCMDDLVAPLDVLYTTYAAQQGATTTGVGDGGNELGMGAALAAVRQHIPLGETIACVTPCDALVSAGVSNWGAWGVVAAAHVLGGGGGAATECALLPSVSAETHLADVMAATGCCDGILGKPGRTVDGMGWQVHTHKLQQLHAIAGGDAAAANYQGGVSPQAYSGGAKAAGEA